MDIKQITHKLLSLIISSLIIFIFLIITQNSSEAESCYRDANNKIVIGSTDSTPVSHDSGSNYDKGSCQEEPLNYKIKFFRVMLCTGEAYVENDDPDFSTCTDIFNESGGKDVEVVPGVKANLFDGDISLPVGTFGFMALIVSNHLGIKHYETYADTNGNDVTIKGYGASSHSTGTVCWTVESFTTYTNTDNNGTDSLHGEDLSSASPGTSSSLGVECGTATERTTNGTYTYTYEILDSLHDDCDGLSGGCGAHANYRAWISVGDTGLGFTANGSLLQSDGTTLGTTRENSVRIGYFVGFDTPLSISEDTKSFDMSFNTSGSVSIDFNEDTQVAVLKNGVDPFTVIVTAGE